MSTSPAIKTVRLRNGAEEAVGLVAVLMLAIRGVWDEQPMAVFELAKLARDPSHQIFGTNNLPLERAKLVEQSGDGWSMDASTRNVVLSSFEGEGLEMTMVDPIDRTSEGQRDELST